MQRDADLKNWPTAVKAIIMASAVHNVEGDRQLSAQDGAGSIDAALGPTGSLSPKTTPEHVVRRAGGTL
jgi:hypothetical protein